MLSKKSPRTICRIGICNNRIGAKGFSNRNCASAPSLESIFRARVSKIVFRQHRPRADIVRATDSRSILAMIFATGSFWLTFRSLRQWLPKALGEPGNPAPPRMDQGSPPEACHRYARRRGEYPSEFWRSHGNAAKEGSTGHGGFLGAAQ